MRVSFTLNSSSVKYHFSWLSYKCPPKMSSQNGLFASERMGVNQVGAFPQKVVHDYLSLSEYLTH